MLEAPLISVSSLTKRYGGVPALRGISFSVSAPSFVAILGPNGAGKTTLVQLLTGLFVPDEGTIRIFGHDMRKDPIGALKQIGVVFQQPTLDLDLSVRANLRFHCDLRGLGRRAAAVRIDEMLERFGLNAFYGRPARELSGGNRRRLELARAMLHKPRILVMDEPTVGLDPATRRELVRHTAALCAEDGVTVFWTTHLVDEAPAADRLLFMNEGAIVFDGSSRQAFGETRTKTIEDAFLAITRRRPGSEEMA